MTPSRTRPAAVPDREPRWRWIPLALLALTGLYVLAGFQPPTYTSAFNLNDFGKLPVLNGGRIKPLDTIARTSLLLLSGRQSLTTEGHSRSALEWLTDVMFQPDQANRWPVFEIDNPDVLGLMGIQQTAKRRYSFADLEAHLDEIERQATRVDQMKSEQRSPFQTAILNLENQLTLYQKLQNTLQVSGSDNLVGALHDFEQRLAPALAAHLKNPKRAAELVGPIMRELERYRFLNHVAEFYPLPPRFGGWKQETWMTFGSGVLARLESDEYPTGVMAYATMSDAWRAGDPLVFNQALADFRTWLSHVVPRELSRTSAEFVFNYYEPFTRAQVIYLSVFLLVFISWLAWPKTLNRAAFYLLLLGFVIHTSGLVARMVLQGRPPVTNLYSSAIFVGWVAVLLGIVLEWIYRNGIGGMVAAVIGFLTLIIAQNLATSGDTMEMMRAVLDSNFWLATHVVCITVGYGSTFLSGFLGVLYLVRSRLDKRWNEETAESLERMVYGIVCFALFFSFTGTILGGIWADQSWGRFWGWDPKENGALMIVLWNAFILHARQSGLAERRGTMLMAVFGNIVTALSWFGVNMLGIGLHSYGFMEKAFIWLIIFTVSQLALIGWGLATNEN